MQIRRAQRGARQVAERARDLDLVGGKRVWRAVVEDQRRGGFFVDDERNREHRPNPLTGVGFTARFEERQFSDVDCRNRFARLHRGRRLPLERRNHRRGELRGDPGMRRDVPGRAHRIQAPHRIAICRDEIAREFQDRVEDIFDPGRSEEGT